ncbi:MAG TPA: glycosyltransferase family 2 protein [Sphingomonas sp.]|nr:glycosyltransferase family 2 protein [Sphingomonas sp.]
MTALGPACVVIPTLNEIAHIDGLLAHLLAEPPEVVGAILVADGGSEDGTREAVRRVAASERRVRLIANPDRIQAAGVNRAVAEADRRFGVIVRVDAHALYPSGYVGKLLAALEMSGADSVVVRLDTVGRGRFQRAVAAAQNSRVGTGGSVHRMGRVSGFVEHGHHAAFRRATFEQAGGYDESFEANEDAELDARIRALGGRIWFDVGIPVTYFPRATLTGLARQYWRYGSGRARTYRKHGERLRLRQMLPPLLLLALMLGLLLAPFAPVILLLPAAYFVALMASGVALAIEHGSLSVLLAIPALATMHCAWGAGFLRRILAGVGQDEELVLRRSIGPASTKPEEATERGKA